MLRVPPQSCRGLILVGLVPALVNIHLAAPSHAGGIGITTGAEVQATSPIHATFHPKQIGSPSQRPHAFRDLEFQWDSLFSQARGYRGFSGSDLNVLGLLGDSFCETSKNPFNSPYPDIQLVYNYFNRDGRWYDPATTPGHSGILLKPDTASTADRQHLDQYIYRPYYWHDPQTPSTLINWGQHQSVFIAEKEDSITGHPVGDLFHQNSTMIPGPPVDSVASGLWTRPDYGSNGGMNHEFKHAVTADVGTGIHEIFASGAEAIAGHLPVEHITNDAAYTWPLIAMGPGGGGSDLTVFGKNYQAFRMFSAYLAYNFRGRDTSAVFPDAAHAGATGFTDDLFYRWAHDGFANVDGLRGVLADSQCYTCSTATYFHPATGPLSGRDRLALLIHNWRVANFVNNPTLAEGQYGYPPQFGFSPAVDVGAWQNLDGFTTDDAVAIPPEITVGSELATSMLTLSGTRWNAAHNSSVPMALQPLGSEYWVIHSDASLAGGADLSVRVDPENLYLDISQINCPVSEFFSVLRDGRLVASLIGYTQDYVPGAPDSLWKHPEWAEVIATTTPKMVDVDSLTAPLEFVVHDFGNTYKAVLLVLSLADGPNNQISQMAEITEALPTLPYRLTLSTRPMTCSASPPVQISASPGVRDEYASWSPAGNEVVFQARPPGATYVQIYRTAASGWSPVAIDPQPLNEEAPDWSPRADEVVYVRKNGNSEDDLWINNVVTHQSRQLTSTTGFSTVPAFQPNGQRIAYAKLPAGSQNWELRRVNLDGTGDALLASLGPGYTIWAGGGYVPRPPRWTPDGQWVYITRNDSVFAVSAEGGALIPRTPALGIMASSLDFSPGTDSLLVEDAPTYRRLCFLDQVTSVVVSGVHRIAVRDTGLRASFEELDRRSTFFSGPRWSPDGTRIAYNSTQNNAPSPSADRDLFVGAITCNHAPVFTSILNDTTLEQGASYSFDLNATDSDGDAVSFAAAYLPPGSTLNAATGIFTWPSVVHSATPCFVVFRALDGVGGVRQQVVKIATHPATLPSDVADLNCDIIFTNKLGITWTAPGDDIPLGKCTQYDVRYTAGTYLDDSNWAGAFQAQAEPSPSNPGILQGWTVSGLQSCTSYTLAMKTRDEAGNWSHVSNAATMSTSCGGGGMGASAQRIGGPEGSGVAGSPPGATSTNTAIAAGGIAPVSALRGKGWLRTAVPFSGLPLASGVLVIESDRTASGEEWNLHLDDRADAEARFGEGEGVVLEFVSTAGAAREAHFGSEFAEGLALRASSGTRRRVYLRGGYAPVAAASAAIAAGGSSGLVLADATHSRLGSLMTESGVDLASAELAPGDTLHLRYALAPGDGSEADWVLMLAAPGVAPTRAQRSPAPDPLPIKFALYPPRPNPFSNSTTLRFDLPRAAHVRLEVLDLQGRHVALLADGVLEAGRREVVWDGTSSRGERLPRGLYLYRLIAGEFHAQRKLTLVP